MAIFTSVKQNLTGLFKGIRGFGDQLKLPPAPQPVERRPDSFSKAGASPSAYREMLNGRAQPPKREVIDAILAEVLDLAPPPPPKQAVR